MHETLQEPAPTNLFSINLWGWIPYSAFLKITLFLIFIKISDFY